MILRPPEILRIPHFLTGTPCPHTVFKCPNCKGPHSAVSRDCPVKKSAMEAAKRVREEGQFSEEIAELRSWM